MRVTGKKRDDLQAVMAAIKAADLGIPIQFNNFRDWSSDSTVGTGRRCASAATARRLVAGDCPRRGCGRGAASLVGR